MLLVGVYVFVQRGTLYRFRAFVPPFPLDLSDNNNNATVTMPQDRFGKPQQIITEYIVYKVLCGQITENLLLA